MPRDGSGGYNLPTNAWNPATNGVSATPADWQQLIEDVAAAIAASISADGQTPIAGNLRMGNNQLTGLRAPTGQGQALRWEQLSKGADIASAGTITIPNEGTLFEVTGTTTISTIEAAFPGRACWLRFADVVTLKSAARLILPGSQDYKTTAGEIVLLININPTAWQLVTSGGGSGGFLIGDYLDTARTPDSAWLRRDGEVYESADYPALAALLPPVPTTVTWGEAGIVGTVTSVQDMIPVTGGGIAALVALSGAPNNLYVGVYNGSIWSTFVSTNMPARDLSATPRGRLINLSTEGSPLFAVSSEQNGISISTNLTDWEAKSDWAGEAFMRDFSRFGDNAVSIHWITGVSSMPSMKLITNFDSVPTYTSMVGVPSGRKLNAIKEIDGMLYVVGEGGYMATSTTATAGGNWIAETTGTTSEIFDIAGDENHIVAATATGLIINSGSGWTAVATATRAMHGIVRNDSGFVSVGPSGYCYTSSLDADAWLESRAATISDGTRIGSFGVDNFTFASNGLIDRSGAKSIPIGVKTKPTSFAAPNDNPTNGWIKAL